MRNKGAALGTVSDRSARPYFASDNPFSDPTFSSGYKLDLQLVSVSIIGTVQGLTGVSMVVEITPIGIKTLGWKFYIIWTVLNGSFVPFT